MSKSQKGTPGETGIDPGPQWHSQKERDVRRKKSAAMARKKRGRGGLHQSTAFSSCNKGRTTNPDTCATSVRWRLKGEGEFYYEKRVPQNEKSIQFAVRR